MPYEASLLVDLASFIVPLIVFPFIGALLLQVAFKMRHSLVASAVGLTGCLLVVGGSLWTVINGGIIG